MDSQIVVFKEFIANTKENIQQQVEIMKYLTCDEQVILFYSNLIYTIEEIEKLDNIKINYINQFQNDINGIVAHLRDKRWDLDTVKAQSSEWKNNIALNYKQVLSNDSIMSLFDRLKFNLDFFQKIGFFNSNIVAIGANGSGKTTLSEKFRTDLSNNGTVISAQRILKIPSFNSISNHLVTSQALKESQQRGKTYKHNNDFNYIQNEFSVVLNNLLAESISESSIYRKTALDASNQGLIIKKPNETNLDKTLAIWNSLIDHRIIECIDGMNFSVKDGVNVYQPIQMSDGEKVLLFLIAQVLQAPKDGFIVVDEPEMYLHKTILKKLWDRLEKERPDCLFIYLTHDLDFATSRVTALKLWIKSFIYPSKWEIERIPSNDLPEQLLLELLGSRKNILFCEGQKGSIDERIYSILFPKLTIMPVGSCFDVISYTKAFNKIPNIATIAYGLIDSDHHSNERIKCLEKDNVYSFGVAEVENLFLDENFLKSLANQFLANESVVYDIKTDVIKALSDMKELQASNYVSAKVNYYFKDSDVSKGNTFVDIESNYNKFIQEIDMQNWYKVRINYIEDIISTSDYNKAISIFNNKGLKAVASKHFKISDFTEKSIKLLQQDNSTVKYILMYFPIELSDIGS